jgi:hypothetical protein
VLSDVLHSYLIRQVHRGESLRPSVAFTAALRAFSATLAMKLVFEARGLLWGLLPIVGIPRVVHHRICWGLASNVVAFEGRHGADGRTRCEELADASDVCGPRALVFVPSLLSVAILLAANFAPPWLRGRAVFWLGAAAILWLVVPASAAVNSFFYLDLVRRESVEPQRA